MLKREVIKPQIEAYLTERGISQNFLANLVGISGATISKMLSGDWEDISLSMWQRVWMEVRPVCDGFKVIETVNMDAINQMCIDAKSNSKLLSVIGYPGAGKTVSLKFFERENPNSYRIECKKAMRPRQFLAEILKRMGVKFSGTVYEMVDRISLELIIREKPVLLIDEAGKLSDAALLYLHDIRDNTEGNAGIVMAGVDYFRQRFLKEEAKHPLRQKPGIPEFYSRVMDWQELRRPTKAEIKAIAQANSYESDLQSLTTKRDFRAIRNEILQERLSPNK